MKVPRLVWRIEGRGFRSYQTPIRRTNGCEPGSELAELVLELEAWEGRSRIGFKVIAPISLLGQYLRGPCTRVIYSSLICNFVFKCT